MYGYKNSLHNKKIDKDFTVIYFKRKNRKETYELKGFLF